VRKIVIIITAGVALGLVGGAGAATHYLITNVNEIKPSVRQMLKGNNGPQGLTGPQGPQGLQGPQGPQGPQGVGGAAGGTGPRGPAGPQSLALTESDGPDTALPAGAVTFVGAACPSGDIATGGGWQPTDVTTATPDLLQSDGGVVNDLPTPSGPISGFGVDVLNNGAAAHDGFAWADCMPGSATVASASAAARHAGTAQHAARLLSGVR
jgi:hypothetical protein